MSICFMHFLFLCVYRMLMNLILETYYWNIFYELFIYKDTCYKLRILYTSQKKTEIRQVLYRLVSELWLNPCGFSCDVIIIIRGTCFAIPTFCPGIINCLGGIIRTDLHIEWIVRDMSLRDKSFPSIA